MNGKRIHTARKKKKKKKRKEKERKEKKNIFSLQNSKIAQSVGISIRTAGKVQIGNEIRFPVAAELFWLFLCVY